jgi:hypothetical protein
MVPAVSMIVTDFTATHNHLEKRSCLVDHLSVCFVGLD